MKNNFFYIVGVGSLGLKDKALFTYSSEYSLSSGQVVLVDLKKKKCLGVVIHTTKMPKFKVKPVISIVPGLVPKEQLSLLAWAIEYYPNEAGTIIKLFLPPSPGKFEPQKSDIETKLRDIDLPPLTQDQRLSIEEVKKAESAVVLHGKTGSGKTRVYIETSRQILKQGKSVLVLSPEISLSDQMQSIMEKSFSGCVSYHSLMTLKQRRQIWQGVAESQKPVIALGPRSALFLPIKDLGLIILDEAHDAAYKQQQSPYYSTLQMAMKLAQLSGSKLIYGSATPNVTDYYVAKIKGYPILNMSERPVALNTRRSLKIESISTKHRDQFSRSGFLSDKAIKYMQNSLKKGHQSLLLLNRRGTAQLLQCETCSWQYRCPTCNHTLVYHKDRHKAVCHYCGNKFPMILVCPEDSGSVKQMSIGTKFVEEACKNIFPGEIIARIDRDSIKRETLRDTMSSLASGDAGILVGTQLLAKGLDLPLLDTVVVLDASQQSSDFLGDERYYQLLHQVIGRGMRGHQDTKVVIQSPDIENKIIEWARHDDWYSFYKHELEERKSYGYPPFKQIATIRFSRKNEISAERVTDKLKSFSESKQYRTEILGPLPVRSKKSGISDWVILLKSTSRSEIVDITKQAPKDSAIDLEPIDTY